MLRIAKKVSEKSRKPRIVIILDMVYCGFKYGAGYYDYQEFEFYALKSKKRKTYLTRAKNNQIIKMYNQREAFIKFDDKAVFNDIFKTFLKRDYLVINENNYEEFSKFARQHQALIEKPIDGSGGTGVEKIVIKKSTDLKKLFGSLISQ